MCPLCDNPSAIAVSRELDVRVACEPCGGDFTIAHEALEKWREIPGGGRVLAILVYDLRAWE
jgi:hypothetical protein